MTVRALTVLYDAQCPICRAAHRWLAGRAQLVPLHFVPAGGAAARDLFPALNHDATLRDVTVVADTGAVYTADAAWLMCLWALDGYRGLALRLAEPGLRPLARRLVTTAGAVRGRTGGYGEINGSGELNGCAELSGYGESCDGHCGRR